MSAREAPQSMKYRTRSRRCGRRWLRIPSRDRKGAVEAI